MVVPEICCDGRTKNARRIHGCAGKRPAEQDIQSNCRSNGKSGDSSSTFVHCRSINDEDKKEGQNCLDQNSLHSAQINRQLRSSRDNHITAEQTEADQRGGYSTEQLRDPVTNRSRDCHVTSAKQAKSDRRI